MNPRQSPNRPADGGTGVLSPAQALERAGELVHAGRLDEAMALCREVCPAVEDAGDPLDIGTCQHVMALCHQYSGRLPEAVTAGYRAIEAFEHAKAPSRLLRMLALQAIALGRIGAASEALELLDRAVHLLPQVADSALDQCIFWNNAASTHQVIGHLRQAVEAGERALALTALHDEAPLAALCASNLMVYRLQWADQLGDRVAIAQALEVLQAYLQELAAAGRHHLVSYGSTICADVLIRLERLDEARSVLQRGIRSALAAGVGPDRGTLELRLASVERMSARYRLAAGHLTVAQELAAQCQDQDLVAGVYLENSRLHEAKKQWLAALDWHKRYAQTHEALMRSQADSRAQALAVRVEVERNRVEAELLRLRNAELEHRMSRLASEAGELMRQAQEDPLTGLANRRRFEQRVAEIQAERAMSGGAPLVVLIADVDHFKRVNDEHSHAIGDRVLGEIGRLLMQSSRPHDVVARFGGEEFVVAFGGGVSLDVAFNVAERLRLAIASHDWDRLATGLRVTASMGLAACAPGESVASALQRADTALYECKHGGRNQVRRAV